MIISSSDEILDKISIKEHLNDNKYNYSIIYSNINNLFAITEVLKNENTAFLENIYIFDINYNLINKININFFILMYELKFSNCDSYLILFNCGSDRGSLFCSIYEKNFIDMLSNKLLAIYNEYFLVYDYIDKTLEKITVPTKIKKIFQ